MHTAAMALVHLPPEEWGGWIMYLFETLEDSSETLGDEFDMDIVLKEVVDRIQERLACGHWS